MNASREHPHAPGPSIWPVALALGVVVLMLGLILSRWVVALGAVLTVGAGLLWVRELGRERGLTHAPALEPERRPPPAPSVPHPTFPGPHEASFGRAKFLEITTLGLGGVIGGLVTLPALGFTIGPSFLDQGREDRELGPLADFPQDEYVVVTFMTHPRQGQVSRQTAFVRYNGFFQEQPSFTILSSRCAHLGCPVQPNAELFVDRKKEYNGGVTLIPAPVPSGFGCPCHGGQYDNEGNVTAGPPVRGLDRFSFSIRNGSLHVGKPFSVSHVDGTGANARIHKWTFAMPGVHVDGAESWLYPIQPPR